MEIGLSYSSAYGAGMATTVAFGGAATTTASAGATATATAAAAAASMGCGWTSMCCSSFWQRLLYECVARSERAYFAAQRGGHPCGSRSVCSSAARFGRRWADSAPKPRPGKVSTLANPSRSEEEAMASVSKDFSRLGQGRFGKVLKLPTFAFEIKSRWADGMYPAGPALRVVAYVPIMWRQLGRYKANNYPMPAVLAIISNFAVLLRNGQLRFADLGGQALTRADAPVPIIRVAAR